MNGYCTLDDCGRPHHARGWCQRHYERWRRHGGKDVDVDGRECWVNPLVCVCPRPVADPRRDFGMCQLCKRKPLELMAVTT